VPISGEIVQIPAGSCTQERLRAAVDQAAGEIARAYRDIFQTSARSRGQICSTLRRGLGSRDFVSGTVVIQPQVK
jgi:hypothetical protein